MKPDYFLYLLDIYQKSFSERLKYYLPKFHSLLKNRYIYFKCALPMPINVISRFRNAIKSDMVNDHLYEDSRSKYA